AFSAATTGRGSLAYSQGTCCSVWRAAVCSLGCGGVQVVPARKSFSTPSASARRNRLPTFAGRRTFCASRQSGCLPVAGRCAWWSSWVSGMSGSVQHVCRSASCARWPWPSITAKSFRAQGALLQAESGRVGTMLVDGVAQFHCGGTRGLREILAAAGVEDGARGADHQAGAIGGEPVPEHGGHVAALGADA